MVRLLAFLLLTVSTTFAAEPLVHIVGDLAIPSGGAVSNAQIVLTPSAAFNLDDTITGGSGRHHVGQLPVTYNVSSASAISIYVAPNTGTYNQSPAGTYYTAKISANGKTYNATLQVGWSASDVRFADVIIPAATMAVTNPVVTSGSTMTGTLILAACPPEIMVPCATPTAPVTGTWYVGLAGGAYYYNGSTWVTVGGGGGGSVTTDSTLTGDGSGGSPLHVATGVLVHNSLSGLTTGDPHTQYAALAGTRAFTGDQSFGQHKLKDILLDPLTTAPTGALAGQVYVNTVTPTVNVSLSGVWVDLRARSTMTGTQLASTISDFTAAVITAGSGGALAYLPSVGGSVSGNVTLTSSAQIKNLRVDNLTSDPGSPTAGQTWINTGSNLYKWYNGAAVIQPLDRALHTGTQVAATISDFTAAVLAALSGATLTGNLSFGYNQAVQFVPEKLGSDPAAGHAGRLFYRTDLGRFRQDNGAAITDLGVGGAGSVVSSPITGSGLGGDPLTLDSSAVSHNALANLTTGNPHTQYVLASGATPLTGNWNLGGTYRITGSADPVDAQDLVTKAHVVANYVTKSTPAITGNMNFAQHEAQFMIIHQIAGDPPAGAIEGQVWENTSTHLLKSFTNGTTITITAGGAAPAAHAASHEGGSDPLDSYFAAVGGATFTGNVTGSFNQLVNWRLHNLASNPAAGHAGYLFWNTSSQKIQVDTGSTIGDITASSAIAIQSNGSAVGNASTINFVNSSVAIDGTTVTVTPTALAGAGAFSNLKAKVTGANTIWVRADSISLSNGSDWKNYSTVNVTLTISGSVGANGPDNSGGVDAANTWVACMLIGKDDGTIATLGVTNTAAPILPSGYTRYRLVTGARNDGSAAFIGMTQIGRNVRAGYENRLVTSGAATSFTTVNAAAFVPPWSFSANIFVQYVSGTSVFCQTRPDNLFDSDPSPTLIDSSTLGTGSAYNEMLTDTQTFDYRVTTGAIHIVVLGYEMSKL